MKLCVCFGVFISPMIWQPLLFLYYYSTERHDYCVGNFVEPSKDGKPTQNIGPEVFKGMSEKNTLKYLKSHKLMYCKYIRHMDNMECSLWIYFVKGAEKTRSGNQKPACPLCRALMTLSSNSGSLKSKAGHVVIFNLHKHACLLAFYGILWPQIMTISSQPPLSWMSIPWSARLSTSTSASGSGSTCCTERLVWLDFVDAWKLISYV